LFFRWHTRKKSAQFRANRKFRERFIPVASAGHIADFRFRGGAPSTAFAVAHRRMKNISRAADRLFAALFCRRRIQRSKFTRAITDIGIAAMAGRRKIRRKLFLQNG
jgi:hypothetical protein